MRRLLGREKSPQGPGWGNSPNKLLAGFLSLFFACPVLCIRPWRVPCAERDAWIHPLMDASAHPLMTDDLAPVPTSVSPETLGTRNLRASIYGESVCIYLWGKCVHLFMDVVLYRLEAERRHDSEARECILQLRWRRSRDGGRVWWV